MTGEDARMREKLRQWLHARWTETFGASPTPLTLERFAKLSAGQSSNLIEVLCRQGERTAEYVIRLEPTAKRLFLKPDVLREAQTLKAIAAYPNVPAPKVWWVEPGSHVLGAPFFVMDQVVGRVPLGRPSLHVTGLLSELQPAARSTLWASAMDALVAIHAVDWRTSHAFLAPADLRHGYFGAYLRQMSDWYTWTARGRKYPLTDAALDYLIRNENRVDDSKPVLVWNDARVGNMIFGEDNRVAAVIDWEGPIIGPAGIDLGYWLMMDQFHAEAIGVSRLPGWPGEAETIAHYRRLAGRNIAELDYFILLAAFFIATTLIRQADLGVEAGRLPADTQMGHANSTTQMIAHRLGMTPPPLSRDFILHRQLDKLAASLAGKRPL
jgi:aminoglycoside phosphotransferase (APT) family kinase protein